MARDMCRDLAACFSWKQVMVGFPSLASRLVEAQQRVVHVAPSHRLRQNQVKNGWINAMDYVEPCYLYFIVFYVLDYRGIVVFLSFVWTINRSLEGWSSLPLI
jgi:hypothetical protein